MPELRSINPTDGSTLGAVKISTKAEIEAAVAAAKKAFLAWRQTPLAKRAQYLLKLAGLLKKHQPSLAELISKEMGKPINQSTREVLSTADYLIENTKIALKFLPDEVLAKKNGILSLLHHEPMGLVAIIKPWNLPIRTPLKAIFSALITGNVVIFKPSENTPLCAKELAQLIWQAGIPKDVFQIIYGSGLVGAMLVDQPVDMVTFTGSSAVGQEIAQKCAAKLIKFSLELGGSTPAIVLKDADLELAANAIVWGRFNNCGQVCNAIKRVFVEGGAAAKLTKLIVNKTAKLKLGNPLDQATDLGPLVSEKQLKIFEAQVTKGVVQSGRIILGGRRAREGELVKGWFHQPTVMIHVHNKMEIMQQEVFGPLLPICEVENLDQAIRLANQSEFGLTAVGFTSSRESARQMVTDLAAGGVYINDEVAFYPGSPWTGLKKSGFGTAGGKFGLYEFTHKRHLHQDFSGRQTRPYWFPD